MEAKDVGFYDVQDNFWGFLTALQQSWNYFYRLVSDINPELSKRQTKEKAKLLIERFKQDELNQNERKAWNIIQAMRNHDTHSEPVMPEIKEKKVFLTRNSKFLTMDGKLLYKKKTSYVVVFENQDIDVLEISSAGINAIKKLRDFVIKTDFS